MTCRSGVLNTRLAIGVATLALAGGVTLSSAFAEDMSAKQIVRGLSAPTTRGLSTQEPSSNETDFLKKMRTQGRGLSTDDREQMAAIASKRPKIDLDINFDYNSATLARSAEPQLKALGDALTSKELAGGVFMLGGHTDAKGSDAYNQALSERRAESVKRFLIDKYRVPSANLVTAGYGEKMLKNPADGLAAENRRVEVVNMTTAEQALK